MIRKVATGLIAFKLKNVKEIQSIFDEYVVGLSKEQFIDILKYVYRTLFDFVYINMDEPWDDMYYRNFNKLILGGMWKKMYVHSTIYSESKTHPKRFEHISHR